MISDGYRSVTPDRIIAAGAGAMACYEKALGAKLWAKQECPDGKLGHAEREIGDSFLMLTDERPGHEAYASTLFGDSPVARHLHVEGVDATIDRAGAAGARLNRCVQRMFDGDRAGSFIDPFGHVWRVATHIGEVVPNEINRRAAAAMGQGTGP